MIPDVPRRILIVDDDDSVRGALQAGLVKAGYEVLQARDGSEALRLWRARGADLVITDLHMPHKNGLEVILELLAESPRSRIIAMSDGGQTKQIELLGDAGHLGAVLTIKKPFTLAEMTAAVNRALGDSPAGPLPPNNRQG
jgi:DNA-binding response OmpR family regulator